jgi:hypothetical protein
MHVLVGTDDGVVTVSPHGARRTEFAGAARSLSVDPSGDCWAALDDGSVARRDSDGRWQRWPSGVDAPLTAVLPTGRGALVGTRDARLWCSVDGDATPVPGFDRVAGRGDWHAVGSATPYVRSLSSTVDGAWLASVHVGGIARSADGGASWEPTVDVDADVHQVRAHPVDAGVAMAAAAVGLLESDDAGRTWSSPSTAGLHATYLRAVAFPTGSVIISASDGPFGRRAALYRRPLDEEGFERCRAGLPEWLPALVDTGALDARGADVAAGCGGSVFASEDGGGSWRLLADDLPPVRSVALLGAR